MDKLADMILTVGETKELKQLEAIIEKGLNTFVDVGKALARIRDAELYKGSHGTFELYCRDKFNLSKAHAYRMIEGAKIVKSVSPIGDKIKTEAVVRPLTNVPIPQRKKVLKQAIETAKEEDRPVTAKDVKKAVKEVVEPELDDVVYDEIGREVPKRLLPLWLRRNESRELLTALTKVKSAMKMAEELRDPLYGKIHYQTFFTHLEKLYHDIKFSVPYAVCGLCQGMKCKVCETGLMSKLQWEQLVPAETRARFEK